MAGMVPSPRSGQRHDEGLWRKAFDCIALNIGDDWKRLGRFLGVAESQLKSIDIEYRRPYDKGFEMLLEWQKLERSIDHDWLNELATKLGEIGCNNIKAQVKSFMELATTTVLSTNESGNVSGPSSSTLSSESVSTTSVADVASGSGGVCFEVQGDDAKPSPEKRPRTGKDVKRRAQEACWLVHNNLLKCRELNNFGEQIDGKPKREMMVSLQTLRSKEMDSLRLNQSKEIEHHLQRSFSDLKAVKLDEIFNDDHAVLVRGLPGSGKSTLCHFILREWHEGRLWKDRCYDFIFYVNAPFAVSLVHSGPFSVDSILKVLYPGVFCLMEYDQLRQLDYLIIVDAIDECDVETICTLGTSMSAEDRQSAITQLIVSPEKYDRIVVGRPHACDKVREKLLQNVAFQYVEVVGFSTEQLKLYVDKFCAPDCNKAAVVWQKINDNQSLFQMVHLPVFANIACNILSENSSVEIEKPTELYVYTYAVFVTRHFKNHPADVDVSTFEKLFSNKYLLDALAKVSKMAFSNLTSGKIFFQASDFSFSEIELTLVTPFLVQRQQFLSFAHLTLMEFLAAVHLFLSGVKFCNSEILRNEHLRGVLPMYFGLLGSLVKDSDSSKIIKSFTRPLINKFDLKPIDKHPLCGKVGEMVYQMDKGYLYPNMFMDLCYEFGNGFLLNDADVFWDDDARIYVVNDQRLTRLLFFMKNLRVGRRRMRTLWIIEGEREFTIDLCKQLSDVIISCGWKVDLLELSICSLNEEKMKILAPAICLVREVDLHRIRASSDECWMILLTSIEDAVKKKTLRLEELCLPPNINESILAQMKKFVQYVYA